jgi:hypothetical protein
MLEEKTQELMVNMQAVLPLIVTNALSALGAIVILIIGLWLSGKAESDFDNLVRIKSVEPPHPGGAASRRWCRSSPMVSSGWQPVRGPPRLRRTARPITPANQ